MSSLSSSFRKHLKVSALSGLLLAIALAHLDIFARVAAQKIQWFEFHLALITPSVSLIPLFLLIALYLEGTFALRKQKVPLHSLKKGYATLSISALLLVLCSIFIFSFQLTESRGELYRSQLLILTGVPLLVFIWTMITWKCLVPPKQESGVIQKASWNYLFILSFFTLGSLAADVYVLQQKPRPSNNQQFNNTGKMPNILLITLDTVRADHLSPYGYAKHTTPFLAELAKQSVVFEQAHSTTSWTLPSHASLFTGRNIESHGATGLHQKLLSKELTLAEILSRHGYRTSGFIGGGYCKAMYGIAQGFQHYSDRLDFFEYDHTYDFFSVRKLLDQISPKLRQFIFQNDGEKTAPEINEEVNSWLECCSEEPFFMFINYFDAHAPYNLGAEYRSEFVETTEFSEALAIKTVYDHQYDFSKRYRNSSVSPELGRFIESLYDSELRYLDHHLQQLMVNLKNRDLLKNTLVVITSDHGEEFLDHGGFSHSLTVFQEVLHVPLLLYFPDRLLSARISDKVSLVDVLPTILEILEMKAPRGVEGRSLLPLIKGESQNYSPPLFASLYPNASKVYQRAVIDGDWKYIRAEPETQRVQSSLFSLSDDALESRNLSTEFPEVVELLGDKISSDSDER